MGLNPREITRTVQEGASDFKQVHIDTFIKKVTGCTPEEAMQAGQTICSDKEALAALSLAVARDGVELVAALGLAGLASAEIATGLASSPVGGAALIVGGAATAFTGAGLYNDAQVRKFLWATINQAKTMGTKLLPDINDTTFLKKTIDEFN